MRTFNVTIRATLTKSIEVDARDEAEAIELAHDQFSLIDESEADLYTEDIIDVDDVTDYRRKSA